MYVSEITRFLTDLKTARPEIEQDQRKGRAIWWDHPQDADETARQKESCVPQQPYVYQTAP